MFVQFVKSNSMTILDKVKKLYEDNHRVGKTHDYTCSSPKNYPHQWLWDSCFHSIVLTHFDQERAKREIKTLLMKQREDGFIPCVSIWKRRFPFEEIFYDNRITQPPVVPLAVEIIYRRTKDLNFVKEVYPKLKLFIDWFLVRRDKDRDSLIEIIHPWETGIDSTPTFDKQLGIDKRKPNFFGVIFKYLVLKPTDFKSESVLMNSIYIKALKSMAYLAEVLMKVEDKKEFDENRIKSLDSLVRDSWSEDEKIFFDLDDKGVRVEIKTISSLMPLIIDDLPDRCTKSLVEHLTNKSEFWSEYPVPSVSMDEPTFDPGNNLTLWRGPTWVNTNWFLAKALIDKGYKKEAEHIISKTVKMIEINNFWEFYNPITGKGHGQPNFSWSGLVLDMLSS